MPVVPSSSPPLLTQPDPSALYGAPATPGGQIMPEAGRPVLYNRAGLRRWRAASADALFTTVPIVCVGDSITAGQGGDNTTGAFNNVPDNTQGWVGQLRTLLASSPQTAVSSAGEGFIFCTDSRITNEGGVGNSYACMPLRNGYRLKSGQKFKLTVPAGVTKIGVIQANMPKSFSEAGSKEADVTGKTKVGAGAETAMTALTNTGAPIETQITVAEGEEFQVLGPATAQTYIVGLNLLTGKSGVLVHRVGQVGYVVGDALGGQTLGALNQSAANQAIAAKANCTWAGAKGLLILSFLVNDQQFQASGGTTIQRGVTLETFNTWMQTVANTAVEEGFCVLLLGEPRSPAEATGANIASADEYCAVMRNFAMRSEHVAFMDVGELWGTHTPSEELGLTAAGSVHPLRPGHGDIARMVYRALVGYQTGGVAELHSA